MTTMDAPVWGRGLNLQAAGGIEMLGQRKEGFQSLVQATLAMKTRRGGGKGLTSSTSRHRETLGRRLFIGGFERHEGAALNQKEVEGD